jgi:hypothetical protein
MMPKTPKKIDIDSSPKADAKGQYARTRHGSANDGVASANPRVLSGKSDGDATFKSDAKENERDRRAPSK